ncbi:glycerol-3-phosphate dehydrogenase C-terminal domain-containing protein [Nocardia sp. 2YAB30]|uniref:glycerol-3-phosphate dehydrogenase C-terminal domain-containing protein n=1 Tax=unclassified Nocardia TaxID=2637762 RepID=UPI003F980486
MPILGAVGYHELAADLDSPALRRGLPRATVERLLGRYGSAITDLFDLIADEPELAEPLAGAPDYLGAEAAYAVTHEGALHLDDVLTRRTRISIEAADRGLAAAPAVAWLVGARLGWDAADTDREITRYRDRVHAELAANQAADDESANAARLVAVV